MTLRRTGAAPEEVLTHAVADVEVLHIGMRAQLLSLAGESDSPPPAASGTGQSLVLDRARHTSQQLQGRAKEAPAVFNKQRADMTSMLQGGAERVPIHLDLGELGSACLQRPTVLSRSLMDQLQSSEPLDATSVATLHITPLSVY